MPSWCSATPRPGVEGIYDLHAYPEEKAAALRQLASGMPPSLEPVTARHFATAGRARESSDDGSGTMSWSPKAKRAIKQGRGMSEQTNTAAVAGHIHAPPSWPSAP